jgi:hypothetical protein
MIHVGVLKSEVFSYNSGNGLGYTAKEKNKAYHGSSHPHAYGGYGSLGYIIGCGY